MKLKKFTGDPTSPVQEAIVMFINGFVLFTGSLGNRIPYGVRLPRDQPRMRPNNQGIYR